MKQTHLFTKTRKEAPADEVAKNAQLLIRAGYIYKNMAGAYSFLPIGLKVIERINIVIREFIQHMFTKIYQCNPTIINIIKPLLIIAIIGRVEV